MKDKVLPDEFLNGVRLFNPTKPYGTIYSDGTKQAIDAKWDQEGILYRGDRTPLDEKKLHWKTRQKLEATHAGDSGEA
jgi:hypothetical protein